ncbi:MAG: RluA family pseudouridine synthase [Bdellovibrionota bacterium]
MERKLVVTEPNQRLDVFLSANIEGLSRKKAREACEGGRVSVNGKAGRAGTALQAGDEIVFLDTGDAAAKPEMGLPIHVHLRTESYLVVEKPRGIPTVRLRPDDPVTLADCVAALDSRCLTASPDSREAGLVQRLDYWTSGLVLAAVNRRAWEFFHDALMSGRIRKSYLALVEGEVKRSAYTVGTPLRQSKDGKRMERAEVGDAPETSFSAQTRVEVLLSAQFAGKKASIVRAFGDRVRRHQIRAHLAFSGHPLVGDELYGAKSRLADVIPEEDGFLLHADWLEVTDLQTGELVSVQSASELLQGLAASTGLSFSAKPSI